MEREYQAMGIFNILFRNTGRASRTLVPGSQPVPQGYRGALLHDPALCTACGACAYVCASSAVTLERCHEGALWHYQPGRCSFCSRCANACLTGALRMLPSGQRVIQHTVAYQACPRCGGPTLPIPAPALARLSGRPVDGDQEALLLLCEKCRARVTGQRLKESILGQYHPNQR
jgi:hydrogenase-4 component H